MKKLFTSVIYIFTLLSYAQNVGLQSFATGFTNPVEITHAPGDSRLFVVQQGGLIRIVNPEGTVNSTPFLNISSLIVSGGERGLLGLAFHPNYTSNGYFYVNYTRSGDGATVIARYKISSDANIADAGSGTILLTIPQPYSNHNGGSVKFGPDGYLYIGMGDGGNGGDPQNRAQNINENLGKILRIDVNSGSPYGIPPTNPYVGKSGNDEIWAIGLRNPWKFSFNRLNGDLWIADVGQNAIEEINKTSVPLPNTGLNFGWNCFEGTNIYDGSYPNCPDFSATVAPIAQYVHASGSCSITGGYVYTGSLYPNFSNKYFFADYCTGEIGIVNSNGNLSWEFDASGNITTFGEDKNGELYVAVGNTIYKIVDTSLGNNSFKKKVGLYPNPAKNEIFIDDFSDVEIEEVKIFDSLGKLILVKSFKDQENATIDIAGISKGMYLVLAKDILGNQYSDKLIVE